MVSDVLFTWRRAMFCVPRVYVYMAETKNGLSRAFHMAPSHVLCPTCIRIHGRYRTWYQTCFSHGAEPCFVFHVYTYTWQVQKMVSDVLFTWRRAMFCVPSVYVYMAGTESGLRRVFHMAYGAELCFVSHVYRYTRQVQKMAPDVIFTWRRATFCTPRV
jgi:uncharacterized membrane protein